MAEFKVRVENGDGFREYLSYKKFKKTTGEDNIQ